MKQSNFRRMEEMQPITKQDLIKMRKLCFTVLGFCLLVIAITVLFTFKAKAQTKFGVAGVKLEYSAKYHNAGGGFFGGYKLGNNYLGADTHVYFTSKRDVPVLVNILYGYQIGQFQPFISGGYFTCGGEAVKSKEGKEGFSYGGGIAYFFRNFPIKIEAGINTENIYFGFGLYSTF